MNKPFDGRAALPPRAAYETDLHAWAMEQAALLRAGRLDAVDAANVAEELEDGVHGALVPPDDPAALAAAMERLLTEPGFAARCAANVRTLSAAVPSWAEIGRRTAAVYAAALGERRPGGRGSTVLAGAGWHARA